MPSLQIDKSPHDGLHKEDRATPQIQEARKLPLMAHLEEIVAEKLRSILQHAEALKERGWSRSRARDYYDLWRILGAHRDRLDLSDFPSFLRQKCAVRGVAFMGPESFFPEMLLAGIEDSWEMGLGSLVPELAPFGKVMSELRPQIASLFAADGPRAEGL